MAQDTPVITMTTPVFAVHRRELVLVGPAGPTPHETKRLSDIDNHDTLRVHVPSVFFYHRRSGAGGVHADADADPVDVIRRALGEVLVPYYPLAGRLREVEERKLVVDCTGEGVAFVEADADVRLADLEAAAGTLMPPFPPWIDHLLCDVDRSSGVLNCPLLFVQVTRLLCGGFVLAIHRSHNIVDGQGLGYFLSAVADLARGGHHPAPTTAAVPPWSRELLEARVPPRLWVAASPIAPQPTPTAQGDMVARAFTFSRCDVAAMKGSLPTRLRGTATTFEALTAALWRARTAALDLPSHEEVRLVFIVGFRGMRELGLPAGYYGNAVVPSSPVLTTAGELQASSLGETVEKLRAAKKATVTAEYVRSTIDLLVQRGRPSVLAAANVFAVSDHRHLGLHLLDLGWGVPVYGGVATVKKVSFLVPLRDGDGEDAVAVPIVLPRPAMDRFASELEKMVSGPLAR